MRLPALAFGVLAVALMLLAQIIPWLEFVYILALAKGFAALGVALLLRANLISIGHALFFGFGAYVTAFLGQGRVVADLPLLLVVSTLVTAVLGFVIGAFVVRYRGIFFAMLNLALSMVFFSLLSKLYGITGGTDGLRVAAPTLFGVSVGRSTLQSVLLYGSLLLLAGVGYLVHRYLYSPSGQALSAISTNELRLEYLGISVTRVLLTTYCISAGLAGLGGALTALAIGHVLPEMSYWTISGQLVLIAVLGGIGGVPGPFLGAVFFETVHALAPGYIAEAWSLIIGASLIGVIFFLPGGLYSLMQTIPHGRPPR
jgi:branched-chain amino acid transport system permease protein